MLHGPWQEETKPSFEGDAAGHSGLQHPAKWCLVYTRLLPWMIQVYIHKNDNRSWTKDCNLRCLQGPVNEWRGTGVWMHSIDIFVLVYFKHGFLYSDCGHNIQGHTHMLFKPPSPLSFSLLEPETWFSSFLVTRSRHMTESWPMGHRQS